MKKVPVIITTEYRGVFFGYVNEQDITKIEMSVSECRNVIYWSSKTRGFLGLSADGPNSDCTIGAKAGDDVFLHKITSVAKCSEKAEAVWKQQA